jgi:molybdopterin-guanine dinucleotide biosynthesis protein B
MNSSPLPRNVISLVGPSGSGKTELISRLLEWFTARGLKVAVLKHGHERKKIAESRAAQDYRQAGAKAVALAGPHLVQITRYGEPEPDLAEILAVLSPQADLVIVEGYKRSPLPKIALAGPELAQVSLDASRIIAWVSREPVDTPAPVFLPDAVEKLGRFILKYLRQASQAG